MKKGAKKPYYGQRTKRQIINEFLTSSASMDELSELHGVLGSNTLSEWMKKYGNSPPKSTNKRKPHAPLIDKKRRKKRFKMDAHFRISELEEDLDITKKQALFYQHAMDIINDLAKELTGIDLLKKTGQELSKQSTKQKS